MSVVPRHPQILADQLTLSQPRGADYAHQIILAPPDFQTFRRPCRDMEYIFGLLCIAIVSNCQWRTIINLLCLFILCKHTKGAKLLTIDCLFSRDPPQKALIYAAQSVRSFRTTFDFLPRASTHSV